MALTDTFVRSVKPSAAPAGDKYTDGGGMFLLVKGNSKYWRMHYRYAGKQKTLAFGVYPAVSLVLARKRREAAREQLAAGIDPNEVKRDEKVTKVLEAANTFELLACQWLEHVAPSRSPKTARK